MHRILVIVVSYNAMRWIDRCLQSVRDSSVPADVFIVDNGSDDGSAGHIRERYPECTVVESGRNLGFGAANNIGLKHALAHSYDFVYLLNQDAWLMEDTLRRLTGAWRKDFGILSPVQKSASGEPDPNFRKHCSKYLGRCRDEAVDVPFVMAAHWLMSTEVVRRAGGFSPAFLHYGEDDNYSDRVRMLGLRCVVLRSAEAVHDRASRKDSPEKRMRLKCTGALVRLMDPGRRWWLSVMRLPAELAGMSVKNLSFFPLKYLLRLLPDLGRLHALQVESRSEGAFLK